MGCVYWVRNKVNGKGYVGKTSGRLSSRRNQHHSNARNGRSNRPFDNALRKYGFGAFIWIVLIENDDLKHLNEQESIWIFLLRTRHPNGYNLTDGGEGLPGWVPSDEELERRKEYCHSKEIKAKISKRTKIALARKSIKRKMSLAGYGRSHTEETKKKISESNKGKHGKRGYHHSEETKRKIGKASMGRKPSEETRRKISEANIGRKHSSEAKAKMSVTRRKKSLMEKNK